MAKPFPDAFFPINKRFPPGRVRWKGVPEPKPLSHICSPTQLQRSLQSHHRPSRSPEQRHKGHPSDQYQAGKLGSENPWVDEAWGKKENEESATAGGYFCIKVLIFQESTNTDVNLFSWFGMDTAKKGAWKLNDGLSSKNSI